MSVRMSKERTKRKYSQEFKENAVVRTRFPGQSKSVHSLLELLWCCVVQS